jgi:hypothetical protein
MRRQRSPDIREDNDVRRCNEKVERTYMDMHWPFYLLSAGLFCGCGWSDSHHVSSAGIDIENLVAL